ncbi:hypothetical protein, partial [Parasutterella excrementihominis]|uniref:hypothetical protein n=1 Tax=Parasutterella excrementihominis TaxID=487175 RepID=UPI00266F288E
RKIARLKIITGYFTGVWVQGNGPNDLKNSCNEKINPRHLYPPKQKGTFVSIPSMACGILKKVPIRR